MRKLIGAYNSWKYGVSHARGLSGKLRATLYWLAEKSLRYLPARLYWDLLALIDPYQTVGLTSRPEDLYQPGNELVDELLRRGLLGPEAITLHIGAGVGRIEYAIAPHVKRAYGIDVSTVLPRVANRKLAHFGNAEFRVGDGKTLGLFGDAMFDVIYSTIAFQHMPREVFRSYLQEAVRTLKPGGALYFAIPATAQHQDVVADSRDSHTMRRYTPGELRGLLAELPQLLLLEMQNEELVGSRPEVDVWVLAQKQPADLCATRAG